MLRKIALTTFLFATSVMSDISQANTFFNDIEQAQKPLIFGAELNPVTFIASNDSRVYFNAGVSIFNRNTSSEIAIPIDYKNIQNDGEQFTAFSVSAHYRKFLNKDIRGYYFSGVTRLTTINSDTTKLGIGFGIGYRKFFDSGLYWGWSVVLGRYLGDNDQYEDGSISGFDIIEDRAVMVDVELLKVGLTF